MYLGEYSTGLAVCQMRVLRVAWCAGLVVAASVAWRGTTRHDPDSDTDGTDYTDDSTAKSPFLTAEAAESAEFIKESPCSLRALR